MIALFFSAYSIYIVFSAGLTAGYFFRLKKLHIAGNLDERRLYNTAGIYMLFAIIAAIICLTLCSASITGAYSQEPNGGGAYLITATICFVLSIGLHLFMLFFPKRKFGVKNDEKNYDRHRIYFAFPLVNALFQGILLAMIILPIFNM